MADEVRRSGRATKGQHTKNVDEPDVPAPKRGKAGRPAKAAKQVRTEATPPEEDEGDAIIRCVCGYVEEDEDDERTMVICDKCSAWQHNICMGISENAEDLPEHYFCEQCKPEDHKELLAQMARGEKPWEERNAQKQREEEEKKGRKRKGKKGKRGRPSEVQPEKPKELNGTQAPAAPSPVPQESPMAQPEVGQKRKLPAGLDTQMAVVDGEHSSKIRKVSTPKEVKPLPQRRKSTAPSTAMTAPPRRDSKEVSLQAELVENISDLQSEARRRVASALVKLFIEQIQQAQKQGAFTLLPGQSTDAFGLRLGLTVEYAIYLNFWGHGDEPKPEYKEKLRMMLHNVKANPTLRDRLLSGSLSPNEFSKMSSDDMASKELQEMTAEMIKESEKQHMLVQEDGPRIRRTHKGEELVGDESQHTAGTESIFTNPPPRRRESMVDPSAPRHISPDPMSPSSANAVELPQDVTMSGTGLSPTTGRPLTVNTNAVPRTSERKSSSAFNIHNVWSSVDSPDVERSRSRHIPHHGSRSTSEQMTGQGVQADAEIENLLKDEEQDDDEPYSPVDYDAEPGTIWRGNLTMASVAQFRGAAKHVAGANLSSVYPWTQLIPHSLQIEGRIDVDRASQYLCGLQWSKTTDVSVVAITPAETPEDEAHFNKLFIYFTERNRYGVISKSPVPSVRDIYLVPLEAGTAKKPEFIELLEDSTVDDNRPTRMLLVTYVIKTKTDTTPSAQATPRNLDGAMIVSPVSTQPPAQYRTSSLSQSGVAMSPIGPYGGSSFSTPTQHQQAFAPPQQQQQQQQQQEPQPYSPVYDTNNGAHAHTHSPPKALTGMDAARQVLGDVANTPSVAELLSKAPATGVAEFGIIKEVFESVPASQGDFTMLMGLLNARMQQ
ncbi:hypothetical protein MMC30_002455 [Trapelia coarctata]|nr:hypothetical protein [Trapelia coarctata]